MEDKAIMSAGSGSGGVSPPKSAKRGRWNISRFQTKD